MSIRRIYYTVYVDVEVNDGSEELTALDIAPDIDISVSTQEGDAYTVYDWDICEVYEGL